MEDFSPIMERLDRYERYLKRFVVVTIYIVSLFSAFKWGYHRGKLDMFDEIIAQLKASGVGKSDELSVPERSEAPLVLRMENQEDTRIIHYDCRFC